MSDRSVFAFFLLCAALTAASAQEGFTTTRELVLRLDAGEKVVSATMGSVTAPNLPFLVTEIDGARRVRLGPLVLARDETPVFAMYTKARAVFAGVKDGRGACWVYAGGARHGPFDAFGTLGSGLYGGSLLGQPSTVPVIRGGKTWFVDPETGALDGPWSGYRALERPCSSLPYLAEAADGTSALVDDSGTSHSLGERRLLATLGMTRDGPAYSFESGSDSARSSFIAIGSMAFPAEYRPDWDSYGRDSAWSVFTLDGHTVSGGRATRVVVENGTRSPIRFGSEKGPYAAYASPLGEFVVGPGSVLGPYSSFSRDLGSASGAAFSGGRLLGIATKGDRSFLLDTRGRETPVPAPEDEVRESFSQGVFIALGTRDLIYASSLDTRSAVSLSGDTGIERVRVLSRAVGSDLAIFAVERASDFEVGVFSEYYLPEDIAPKAARRYAGEFLDAADADTPIVVYKDPRGAVWLESLGGAKAGPFAGAEALGRSIVHPESFGQQGFLVRTAMGWSLLGPDLGPVAEFPAMAGRPEILRLLAEGNQVYASRQALVDRPGARIVTLDGASLALRGATEAELDSLSLVSDHWWPNRGEFPAMDRLLAITGVRMAGKGGAWEYAKSLRKGETPLLAVPNAAGGKFGLLVQDADGKRTWLAWSDGTRAGPFPQGVEAAFIGESDRAVVFARAAGDGRVDAVWVAEFGKPSSKPLSAAPSSATVESYSSNSRASLGGSGSDLAVSFPLPGFAFSDGKASYLVSPSGEASGRPLAAVLGIHMQATYAALFGATGPDQRTDLVYDLYTTKGPVRVPYTRVEYSEVLETASGARRMAPSGVISLRPFKAFEFATGAPKSAYTIRAREGDIYLERQGERWSLEGAGLSIPMDFPETLCFLEEDSSIRWLESRGGELALLTMKPAEPDDYLRAR